MNEETPKPEQPLSMEPAPAEDEIAAALEASEEILHQPDPTFWQRLWGYAVGLICAVLLVGLIAVFCVGVWASIKWLLRAAG